MPTEELEHGQDPNFDGILDAIEKRKEEVTQELGSVLQSIPDPRCPSCKTFLDYTKEGTDANGSPVQESYNCEKCHAFYDRNQVL